MRHEKKASFLIAVILSFCISFGGIACIITGFSMHQDASVFVTPVDLWGVMLFCAVFSVVAVTFFWLPKGKWILLCLLALVLGYLWRTDALEVSLEAVLYRITYIYNRAYRWGVVYWTGANPSKESADLGMCVFAAIPAIVTAGTVYCRKGAVWVVLCACLMLGVCLVVTDTVPENWCLFLLLASLVLLILTNFVRRQDSWQGAKLTAWMLIPSLVFTSLMFRIVPQESYEPATDSMQQMLTDWLNELAFVKNYSGVSSGAVDLSTVGPKTELYYAVMDVTAPQSGMLYLRGQSLDVYNGKSWNISEASSGWDHGWPNRNTVAVGTVSISTRFGIARKYFPYYPDGSNWPTDQVLKDGVLSNSYGQREYTFTQLKIIGSTGADISRSMREQCLALPSNTKYRAREQLKKMGDYAGKSNREIAAMIGEYVSGKARYDLNTDWMPSYEGDFAIWFLQDGESGYCVHYATAAAVLLRAAGIPARYVSGYAVRAQADTKITVTENRAHAWVEYFVPNEGWMVLDATPSDWYGEEELPTEPVESTPPQTDATEPTERPGLDPTEPPTHPGNQPTEPSVNATEPSLNHNAGGRPSVQIDLSWLWEILKWLGMLLGICAVIGGQYHLRLRIRKKRMHTGHPNQRALARWQAVVRMSRILKEKPPEALYELAEKAKYSQHTLSAGERMEFDRYLNYADEELNKKAWFKRWMIRLFWAV